MNGLVYLAFIYLHGEWRDLVPRRGIVRDAWRDGEVLSHGAKGSSAPGQAQRAAAPRVFLDADRRRRWRSSRASRSGSRSSCRRSPNLLGGYVWARYWHFWAMLLLVALTVGHVFMVFTVDPYSIRVDDHRAVSRGSVARSAQRAPVRSPAAAGTSMERRQRPEITRAGRAARDSRRCAAITPSGWASTAGAFSLASGGALGALFLAACDSQGPKSAQAAAQVRRAEERDARARAVPPYVDGRAAVAARCRRARISRRTSSRSRSRCGTTPTRGPWHLEIGGMVRQAAQALARRSRGAAAHRLQARSLLRRRMDRGRDAHRRAAVRPRATRRRAAAGASTSTSSRSTTTTTRAGTSRARCIHRRSSCTRRTDTT